MSIQKKRIKIAPQINKSFLYLALSTLLVACGGDSGGNSIDQSSQTKQTAQADKTKQTAQTDKPKQTTQTDKTKQTAQTDKTKQTKQTTAKLPTDLKPTTNGLKETSMSASQNNEVADILKGLNESNADDAITKLFKLQSKVGFNSELAQAIGTAQAVDKRMTKLSLKKLVANDDSPNSLLALYQLTGYVPTKDGKISAQAESDIRQGSAILANLAPNGVSVNSLPDATQDNIATVSTIQTIRVLAAVLETSSIDTLFSLNEEKVNAVIAKNYNADRKAQLQQAVRLMSQTSDRAKNIISDGSKVTDMMIDKFNNEIGNTLVDDSNISKKELKALYTKVPGFIKKLNDLP